MQSTQAYAMNKQAILSSIWQQTLQVLPEVVIGILLFLTFWVLGSIVNSSIRKLAAKAPHRQNLYELIGQAVKLSLLVIGAIVALGTMGVDITPLVASLGLSGFALTFALKDSLSNILSGLMILFYSPFKLNDYIKVDDKSGQVTEINLRYTAIQSDEGQTLIPNANLLNKPLTVNKNNS